MFVSVEPAATFLTATTLEGSFGSGCQGMVRKKRMERSLFPTLQARAKRCLPHLGFRMSCVLAGRHRRENGNFTTSSVVLRILTFFPSLLVTFQSPQLFHLSSFRATFSETDRVDKVCLAILPRIKTCELSFEHVKLRYLWNTQVEISVWSFEVRSGLEINIPVFHVV